MFRQGIYLTSEATEENRRFFEVLCPISVNLCYFVLKNLFCDFLQFRSGKSPIRLIFEDFITNFVTNDFGNVADIERIKSHKERILLWISSF